MKIKIQFNETYKILQIPVILKTPLKRVVSNFILDTGSPHTILNYTDAIRLGIPHIDKSEIMRIAGRVYQSYVYNKFKIIFKSEDNTEIVQEISIRALKVSSNKINEIENIDRMPNLLGLDFLETGYKLYCDLKQRQIFLEILS